MCPGGRYSCVSTALNRASHPVTGIAPRASEATHTFPVIVEVDNAQRRLGSGMLVRAALSLNETFTSLAVSKDAIVRQGDETLVYVVTDGVASAGWSARQPSKKSNPARTVAAPARRAGETCGDMGFSSFAGGRHGPGRAENR